MIQFVIHSKAKLRVKINTFFFQCYICRGTLKKGTLYNNNHILLQLTLVFLCTVIRPHMNIYNYIRLRI